MLVCVLSIANLHARPRVQRAPGLPCALCIFEGGNEAQLGRTPRRENFSAVRKSNLLARAAAPLPPRVQRAAGRGRGWGVAPRVTALSDSLRLPPPPTPPRHCVGGGEQ